VRPRAARRALGAGPAPKELRNDPPPESSPAPGADRCPRASARRLWRASDANSHGGRGRPRGREDCRKCAPEEYQAAVKALEGQRARRQGGERRGEEAGDRREASWRSTRATRRCCARTSARRENAPPVAAVDVDDFIDKSAPGSIEGSERRPQDGLLRLNSSDLGPEARQTLSANAAWLKSKAVKVTIEGHCDKRGSTEYNLALGERRAHDRAQLPEVPGREPGSHGHHQLRRGEAPRLR
jgi:outer membrane protein OmpA-like peptidoglycan-associated protein